MENAPEYEAFRMSIQTRIRKYEDKPVEKEKIFQILKAGKIGRAHV